MEEIDRYEHDRVATIMPSAGSFLHRNFRSPPVKANKAHHDPGLPATSIGSLVATTGIIRLTFVSVIR